MSEIIDGWGKVEVDDYFFPNSGKAIRRDCSLGKFCVELTKETIAMIYDGVSFETAVHCAFKWAGEWGGFNRSGDVTLAYMLLNKHPVFMSEDLSGFPTATLKYLYRSWLKHNEWYPEKKGDLIREWNKGFGLDLWSSWVNNLESGERWER